MPKDEFLELLRHWQRDAFVSMASIDVTDPETQESLRTELRALRDEIHAREGTIERKGPKAKELPPAPAKVANSGE